MKIVKTLVSILILTAVLTGATCKNPNRGAFNTLGAAEQAVKSSYDGYVDSVIQGNTRTNEMPVISKSFNAFQSSMGAAVDAASGNTNAPVTQEISTAASDILAAILKVKGVK